MTIWTACKSLLAIIISASLLFSQTKTQKKNIIDNVASIKVKRSTTNTYLSARQSIIYPVFSPTSTIIFEESFDGATGFPPSGWKTLNADGGGTSGPWFQGSTSIFPAYSGSGYAAANYQGASDFYIDEWLISPQIMSITTSDTLLFWHRSPDNSPWDDSIEVRISLTDTARTSFAIKLGYFKTSTSGWAQKKFPLHNYVPEGSNIYIAFRYLLFNAGVSGISSDYVGIDLVQIVRTQVAKDIKVTSIDYPSHQSKILFSQSIAPRVTFQNSGSTSQTNIPVKLRIIPPSGTEYVDNDTIPLLNPTQAIQLTFGSYTPSAIGTFTVRAYSLLSGDQNTANDSLTSQFISAVLLSGTFTVGAGGIIPTMKQAFDTLNQNIIADDINLVLISSLYNEPPLSLGPLDYAFSTNQIIIQPDSNVSPTLNIAATTDENFGLRLLGVSKITIDGSYSYLNTRNLTIDVNGENGKIGILILGTEGNFADSNIVKNLNIQTGADSASSSEGYYGILLYGSDALYKDAGNRISHCNITQHGAVGIATQWQEGVILENNFIHDWTQLSGENDVCGIWLASGTTNPIVRGNVIGNLNTLVNYFWACGIENSAGTGSNALLYNNMIYGILASGTGIKENYSRGIYGSDIANTNDRYYYNSIYLSGNDASTSALSRTAGFEFVGGTNIVLKNNIVFNESAVAGMSEGNKAYCIYLSTLPTDLNLNNNCWYAIGVQGVIGYNSGNRTSLTDWKISFSPLQDSASLSANPLFVSQLTGDLHIQTTVNSPVNAAGTPVSGITTDLDFNLRDAITPDIGADEFVPVVSSLNLMYSAGWNMISVPLEVDDYHTTSLFSSAISQAFTYLGGYIVESVLTNGLGYWLKFNAPQNIELSGRYIPVDTVKVSSGWNMVGSVTNPTPISNIASDPPNMTTSEFYKFSDGYSPSDTLHPGKGYWVKVSQAGSLIFSSDSSSTIHDHVNILPSSELPPSPSYKKQ